MNKNVTQRYILSTPKRTAKRTNTMRALRATTIHIEKLQIQTAPKGLGNSKDDTTVHMKNEALIKAREAAGYKNATVFATANGIHPPTYRAHERGDRALKPDVAKRYAEALNVDWVELLRGNVTPTTTPPKGDQTPDTDAETDNSPRLLPPGAIPVDVSAMPYDLPIYVLDSIDNALSDLSTNHMEGFGMREDSTGICRRPPGLDNVKDAYATYAPSNALARYEKGELLFIHPDRPAKPGDAVLILFERPDAVRQVFIGRLQSEDTKKITITSDNPATTQEFAKTMTRVHKILNNNEMMGH